MLDFKLSKEGDLVLGEQSVDENGFLLYYQLPVGDDTEPYLTRTPSDLTIPVRDIDLVYEDEADLQFIWSRMQTENPDWRPYPNVGADLTDLIGMPNTPETARLGEDLILRSLTYDGAFKRNDLEVNAIPVGPFTLFFDVKLKRGDNLVRYSGTMDLEMGVWNEYDLHQLD